jgi:hypothetical protein
MQWLQRLLPKLLVLGAAGVVVAALLSDHHAEYGDVTLPRGGVVTLPEGTVNVFVDESTTAPGQSDDSHNLSSFLKLEVVPVAGGEQLTNEPAADEGGPDELSERSEAIGSRGTVATIEVPAAGEYRVSGGMADETSAEVSFGLNSFRAVAHEWKLIAGLLAGAFLISVVPLPKRRSGEDSFSSGEGVQGPSYSPYRG